METKIPPPIVTLIFGLSIYFSREIFQAVDIKHSFYIGTLLLLLGFVILISAVRLFRNDKTTVNPLSPEQATKLVTNGIFQYSRNPMYLGMAFILSSMAVFFNLIGGAIFIVLFWNSLYRLLVNRPGTSSRKAQPINSITLISLS